MVWANMSDLGHIVGGQLRTRKDRSPAITCVRNFLAVMGNSGALVFWLVAGWNDRKASFEPKEWPLIVLEGQVGHKNREDEGQDGSDATSPGA